MIKVEQIQVGLSCNEGEIKTACAKKLKIKQSDIESIVLLKKSIDARRKPKINYILNVGLNLKNNLENKFAESKFDLDRSGLSYQKKSCPLPPVIVGFGPSGMFAGLALARMGFNPIIIEQGKCVEEREKDVLEFWNNRKLNRYSNVQFGEGGAGTFSDGKLNSNVNNIYCKKVLNELYHFGAPEEILYQSKPHIGSDKLKKVVKNLRNEIISLGGKVLFSHKFVDFETKNNEISKIFVENLENNERFEIKTNHLLLCVGHSARDVFSLLYDKGANLAQKPFAMGVRIEQKQSDINLAQFGQQNPLLPPADYKLVTHLPSGRSVFTFCMCPGGEVVSSSSNEGEVVTNGMSNFARDKENANSALLVNVLPSDYPSSHPLAGIEFQAKYEKLAFMLGGENYNAPAQTVGSFLGNKKEGEKRVSPSLKPGVTFAQIEKCLPDFVIASLKEALPILDKKLKGFAKDENLLIAIESRSSCPLTILRDENFVSSIKGIYPVGEGAGYAGGIISSAQDGIKVAESIYNNTKND